MNFAKILSEIDQEIARLEQAKALLTGSAATKKRVGRPVAAATTPKASAGKKKRNITPEGRKRIAEAVKKRWERQRKTASK